MKTTHAKVAATLAVLSLAAAPSLAETVTFSGNGATGFGGTLGNGSLTVSNTASDPDTISFTFTPGTSFDSNAVAIFIDSVAGGVDSTESLNAGDINDNGQRIVSGTSSNGRTVADFTNLANFGADYAVTIEPGFGGLFTLPDGGGNVSLDLGTGQTPSGSGTDPRTVSFSLDQLGLTAGGNQTIKLVATLISVDAFRSNETIGASTSTRSSVDNPNPGFNGTTTFSSFETFQTVPSPTAVGGGLLLGGVVLLRRRS